MSKVKNKEVLDSYLAANKRNVVDLLLPILIWATVIVVFLNVKKIPFDFISENKVATRYFTKFLMMILFPIGVIYLFHKEKAKFGIHFPKFTASFRLSLRSYFVCGPAGISFPIIAYLGWSFRDWYGTIVISVFYCIGLILVPLVTRNISNGRILETSNNRIKYFVILGLATIGIAFLSYEKIPVLSKVLYYTFIVGFGEELFFRGYLQSSFNTYFGKQFSIANVSFGWGLLLSALLFGLMHSLVTVPPTWPWAVFTFVLGLIFGYLREKDGSILSAVLLHAMADMPLAFIVQ
ncbi:MAG: CPBP family intramembrane glutamic endopeptidase [Bacteroidota bacterium]